jgi:hypothetical protein
VRKISSWLQHSDSYTPDFFASSDVFIKAPFNRPTVVHERFHKIHIENVMFSRAAALYQLAAGSQLAKSWQAFIRVGV